MSREQDVCKGAVALGTGCKRCSKCAIELAEIVANLHPAKPEQAQTAVVLPEPINRDEVLDRYVEKWPWDEVGAYMDGYNTATAKTAEAVRELVGGLRELSSSLRARGKDDLTLSNLDALKTTDTLLTKYAPKKKEQG